MKYSTIPVGLFAGLPAILLDKKDVGLGLSDIQARAGSAIETLGLVNGKKAILLDLRGETPNDLTVTKIGLLRDHGFFVVVWTEPEMMRQGLRVASAVEMWVDATSGNWPQFATASIIMEWEAGLDPQPGKHLENVAKFVVVNERVSPAQFAWAGKLGFPVRFQVPLLAAGVAM